MGGGASGLQASLRLSCSVSVFSLVSTIGSTGGAMSLKILSSPWPFGASFPPTLLSCMQHTLFHCPRIQTPLTLLIYWLPHSIVWVLLVCLSSFIIINYLLFGLNGVLRFLSCPLSRVMTLYILKSWNFENLHRQKRIPRCRPSQNYHRRLNQNM